MNPIDDPKTIKPGDVIAMDGPPIYAEAASSTEDLAREAGFDAYANGAGGVTIQAPDDGDDLTAEITKLVALVRAQALDEMMAADPALAASLVALLARKLSRRLRVVSTRLSEKQN